MSEKKIKVTDKRSFTAEGELKNEFRHREESETPTADAPPEAPTENSPVEDSPILDAEAPPSDDPVDTSADPQMPPTGQGYVAPTFFDLVGVVAQPIALYLGDAKMPDGESLENLELARLYIDLLEILYKKSTGNLSPEEDGFLKDLLYQLRLRYVEKSG